MAKLLLSRAIYLLLVVFFISCTKDKATFSGDTSTLPGDTSTPPVETPVSYTGSYLCARYTYSYENNTSTSDTALGVTYFVQHNGDSVIFNGETFPIDSAGEYNNSQGDPTYQIWEVLHFTDSSLFYTTGQWFDTPPTFYGNNLTIEGLKL